VTENNKQPSARKPSARHKAEHANHCSSSASTSVCSTTAGI
jgi:hypothetical protein